MNVDVSTYTDKDGNRLMYAAPSNKSPASDAYEQMVAERVNKIRCSQPENAGHADSCRPGNLFRKWS